MNKIILPVVIGSVGSLFSFKFSDSSVGRSVSLIPSAAATETVVDTLAESAEEAAETGPDQNDGDTGHDEPDPDVGAALTIKSSESRLLVAVRHVIHALVIHDTGFSPEGGKEAINLLLGISQSIVDVVLSVEEVSGG